MINDIILDSNNYVAEFSSRYGGNCYRLIHKESRADVFRFPEDENDLQNEIFLFGNPILFPPNRIRNGSFIFEGREYRLPVNEPENGCHIHGDLYRRYFRPDRISDNQVDFYYSSNEKEYIGFLNSFDIIRHYTLDENGLCEVTEIRNLS
ncbi:MAG: hypothetical protein J5850_06395, partial [Clostridia bacterium]|nr:hypothetical protein [Clostridia bacterium]